MPPPFLKSEAAMLAVFALLIAVLMSWGYKFLRNALHVRDEMNNITRHFYQVADAMVRAAELEQEERKRTGAPSRN